MRSSKCMAGHQWSQNGRLITTSRIILFFFMPCMLIATCLTKPVWLMRGGQGEWRRNVFDLIGEWSGATAASETELAVGLDVVLDHAENLCRFCSSAGFRAKPQIGAGWIRKNAAVAFACRSVLYVQIRRAILALEFFVDHFLRRFRAEFTPQAVLALRAGCEAVRCRVDPCDRA